MIWYFLCGCVRSNLSKPCSVPKLPIHVFHVYLASYIAYRTTEKQGHRHVCRPWRRGPKTPSKPVDKNLDSASVQNALAYTYNWWLWRVNRIDRIEWVTRPGDPQDPLGPWLLRTSHAPRPQVQLWWMHTSIPGGQPQVLPLQDQRLQGNHLLCTHWPFSEDISQNFPRCWHSKRDLFKQ